MGKLTKAFTFVEKQASSRRRISPKWHQAWMIAVGYRYVRNFLAEEPEVIREVVGPGQQLVITHYAKGDEPPLPPAPPSRRARRRQAKAAKAERKAERRTGAGSE